MKEVKDPELLHQFLQPSGLFEIFPESIQPYMTLHLLDRGEHLCRQGDPFSHLYILVKGKLKVYTTSLEGKTIILSFQTPLDVIGDIEFVQRIDIINTVEAVTPVYLLAVHKIHLRNFVGDYPPFLQFLLKVITEKFYIKSNSSSLNLMYPVETRLASYLLSVSFEDSGESEEVSISDAANLIGTSYRHLNRVIQRFSKEGLIERQRGLIQVRDRQGLQAYASRSIYENGNRKVEHP